MLNNQSSRLEYYKSTYNSEIAVGTKFTDKQGNGKMYRGATITWENIDVHASEVQSSFRFLKQQKKAKKQILKNGGSLYWTHNRKSFIFSKLFLKLVE